MKRHCQTSVAGLLDVESFVFLVSIGPFCAPFDLILLLLVFIMEAPLDLDELLWVLYQSSISDENASASELVSFAFVLTTVAAKVDPLLLLDILDLFTSRAVLGGGGGGYWGFKFPFSCP